MWRDRLGDDDFRHGDADRNATRKVPVYRLVETAATARVPKFVLEDLVAETAAAETAAAREPSRAPAPRLVRSPAPPLARVVAIAAVVLAPAFVDPPARRGPAKPTLAWIGASAA